MRSSFIVCTLNRPDDLCRLVSSIARQSVPPAELIVVDASEAKIRERNHRQLTRQLAATTVRFEHIVSAEASLPLQRNRGIERASGDLLFFIDDDVVLGADFHEKMVALHRKYGPEGIVGIQPTVNAAYPGFGRRGFWVLFHPELRARRALQTVHESGDAYARAAVHGQEVCAAEWLSGACMSFARGPLLHFRFDESLHGYAPLEDVDLTYRLSRRYRLVRAETVRVNHTLSPCARLNARQVAEMRMVNRHYLFCKNIPQTPIHRLAYCWATVGHVVRACIAVLMTGEPAVLLGTGEGLIRILRGAIPIARRVPAREMDASMRAPRRQSVSARATQCQPE